MASTDLPEGRSGMIVMIMMILMCTLLAWLKGNIRLEEGKSKLIHDISFCPFFHHVPVLVIKRDESGQHD